MDRAGDGTRCREVPPPPGLAVVAGEDLPHGGHGFGCLPYRTSTDGAKECMLQIAYVQWQ